MNANSITLWRTSSTALAFCLAALFLAVPACLLPFVTLNKLGNIRVCFLTNTAAGLTHHGMWILGGWVFFCGMLAPLLLILFLVVILCKAFGSREGSGKSLRRLTFGLSHWVMPEVLALGVLVSIFKVRDLVEVRVGPGFWCYLAAMLMLLFGWQSFKRQADGTAQIRGR